VGKKVVAGGNAEVVQASDFARVMGARIVMVLGLRRSAHRGPLSSSASHAPQRRR
jgi:hypothetical protein